MCLRIDENEHTKRTKEKTNIAFKPKTAKKDIVCWKYLEFSKEGGKSPFQDFIWKKDRMEETEMLNVNGNINTVDKGFHGFTKKNEIYNFRIERLVTHTSVPDNAIMFSNTSDSDTHVTHERVSVEPNAKMIIPKGAKYYLGENNNIVSNKMKLVEMLKGEEES